MDHYNSGGEPNPFLDGAIIPLGLNKKEIDAMVAFMFTLTDDRFAEQNQTAIEEQRKLAEAKRSFRNTDLAQGKILPFEYRALGKPGLAQESPR